MSLTFHDEAEFEAEFVKVLSERKGWSDGILRYPTEEELVANWAQILFESNRDKDKLNGCPLTPTEMQQVINQVNQCKTPAERNRFINGHTLTITRDNKQDAQNYGRPVSLRIYDRQQIAGGKSRYQIAVQPKFKARKKVMPNRRGDVMLLINGMPLIHVELKRSGVEVSQAIWQIEKYAHEGIFDQGILSLVQIFVAMNPDETKYFANPGSENLSEGGHFRQEFMFHWADENNTPQNDWAYICEHFLSIPMAHKMIGFYTVPDAGDGVLKVMRSYQYYAASAISDAVGRCAWGVKHPLGGYIAHTTGSGKTLTSFKSAQLVAASHAVDKVVFLVDRIELGDQSLEEYRNFARDDEKVNATENTDALVALLTSDYRTDTLIVTSIQKMGRIRDDGGFASPDDISKVNEKKVVFIVDECHRDTFGEMMASIKETFPYALLFGFTGTPIYDENKKELMTTGDVFGDRLHLYSIGDGIRDGNVLGFDPVMGRAYSDDDLRQSVALDKAKASTVQEALSDERKKRIFLHFMNDVPMATKEVSRGDDEDVKGIEDLAPSSQWDTPEYRLAVVRDIARQWKINSLGGKFHAIFATSSRPDAIDYYRLFKMEVPELKVCALFNPDIPNDESAALIEDGLVEILEDYSDRYGRSFTIPTHGSFKTDLSHRLAHKYEYRHVDKHPELVVDILIVVNQMLTGFDSKWINTLYLDKVLEYERVIQAFSRTNRIFGIEKPFGRIFYYRKPHTMQRNVERAIRLYSGESPVNPFVSKLRDNLADMNAIYGQIERIFRGAGISDFEALPESDDDRSQFAALFKQLNLKLNAARVQGFKWGQLAYGPVDGVDPEIFLDFDEQSYLVLALRYKELFSSGGDGGGGSVPYDIDVNLTTINTGRIDATYMESKFKRWLKALGQENVTPEQTQEFLDDLHMEFAKLSQRDQALAEIIIHDIQGGDLQLEDGVSFHEYLSRYRRAQEDERILSIVDAFGVDRDQLVEVMHFAGLEDDINSHGRLDALKDSIDKDRARAFFEEIAGKPLRPRIVTREAKVLLTRFIEEGGFDLRAEAEKASFE